MDLSNYCQLNLNADLNELEQVFKQLYMQYSERALDKPHSLDYCKDILKIASQRSKEPLLNIILENNILEEKLFFQNGLDVAVYRHLRFLPTNWHTHSFFEVVYVVQGNCTNYIIEQEITMQTGDICIIAPNTAHALSVFTDDCMILNIVLRTSTFETAFFGTLSENDILSDFFMRTLYHSKTHPYLLFKTRNDPYLRNFVGYAYKEFMANHQYKKRMLNSIVDSLFIMLLRNHGAKVCVPDSNNQNSDQNLIYILKYIQEHYCTLTLKELAAFFNYSERQLQRIIKSSTGMSFIENVQKLKMNQAAKLLSNPDMSISVIAEELGYSDTGNFRHVFKKYYGMTPVEFRAKDK